MKKLVKNNEYVIDWDKVKTIDDIKKILKALNIRIHSRRYVLDYDLEKLVRKVW